MRGPRRTMVVATMAVIAAGTVGRARFQETSDYTISRYVLTIALSADGVSARATMDLTYAIRSGVKSEGFKYVGALRPTDLEGTEDGGTPMKVSLEYQRETLIKWRFTPSRAGEKRVRISFTIPQALTGDTAVNTFSAPWAGVFKVPVHQSTYRVLWPVGWPLGVVTTSPPEYRRVTDAGRPAIEVEQRPLADTAFFTTFEPGLITAPIEATASTAVGASSSGPGTALSGVMVVLLIGALVLVVARAQRSKRKGAGGGSSSSSCAGGSSCSSSCGGGSCGGGCGG